MAQIPDLEVSVGILKFSLRDWFAGQALIGILGNKHMTDAIADAVIEAIPDIYKCPDRLTEGNQIIADLSYRFSDAMLAERAKQKGESDE